MSLSIKIIRIDEDQCNHRRVEERKVTGSKRTIDLIPTVLIVIVYNIGNMCHRHFVTQTKRQIGN